MYGYDVRYTPLITNTNTAFPLLTNNTLTSSHPPYAKPEVITG